MPNAGETPGPGRPRILVCGWAGAGNVGDELLTDWVVAAIDEAGGRAVVTSRDTEETMRRHPGAGAVRWGLRDLRRLDGIDGVLVGPGGILQDSSSLWSLPGHLAKAVVAGRRGIPVAAVGVGAEPLGRRSSRRLLRRALGGAVAVVARDEPSAEAMRAAGVPARAAIDVVFDLDGPEVPTRDELVVAVGPSVAPGLIRSASSRLTSDDPQPIASALGLLAERLGARVVLTTFRGRRDVERAQVLADLLGAGAEIADPDPDQLRQTVAGARAVVSSRYHAVVLAVASGVPAIVRSDQSKLVDLVAQVADDRRASVAADWESVAQWDPGPVIDGVRPGSVDEARAAVADLVEAAIERRRSR